MQSVMMSLLMTSLPGQCLALTFSMHINIQIPGRSCKLSFLFLPHRQSALESLLAG